MASNLSVGGRVYIESIVPSNSNQYVEYTMGLEVFLNSQNIDNNTSNITLVPWFKPNNNSSGFSSISHTYLKSWLKIGSGGWSEKTSVQISNVPKGSGWKEYPSWTGNVKHNSDGTLQITANIQFICGTSTSYLPKNKDVSEVINVATIPRESSISSFGNFTIGNNFTVGINSASSAFKHELQLYVGNKEIATRDYNTVGTTSNYTFVLTTAEKNKLYDAVPNKMSETVIMWLRTRSSSGTVIGGWVSKNATATIPNTLKPTITGVSVVIDGSGKDKDIGKYVQNISKAKVSFSANIGRGATLKKQTFKIGNAKAISGNGIASDVLTEAGADLPVTIFIEDSRGNTKTHNTTKITVHEYSPPKIDNFKVYRDTNNPSIVHVIANGTWNNLGNDNKLNRKIAYNEVGSSTIMVLDVSMDLTEGTHSYSNQIILSDSTSFEFILIIKDLFKEQKAITTIGTGKVALSMKKNIGIGVGKVWEQGALDVGEGGIFQENKELFGIIESGGTTGSGNGYYIKYSNGIMKQYGFISKNLPFTSTWGTFYYSDMGYVEYPIEFKNTPFVYFSDVGASSTCFIGSTSGGSESRTPRLDVYRPVSGSATVAVSWLAIGWWK